MRLRRLLVALLLALPLLGAKGRPAPTTAVEDELDRTALAARLIADGFWDRAATVLAEVDPDTEDGLDRGRFFTLRGLVRSHEGLHDQAAGDFRLALAEPDETLSRLARKTVWMDRGRSRQARRAVGS